MVNFLPPGFARLQPNAIANSKTKNITIVFRIVVPRLATILHKRAHINFRLAMALVRPRAGQVRRLNDPHRVSVAGPSITITYNSFGPCTPTVSVNSISAVREGPVMKVMARLICFGSGPCN